ncbi:MAG: TIM barrel protein [Leeuwenhoekiella sp.]
MSKNVNRRSALKNMALGTSAVGFGLAGLSFREPKADTLELEKDKISSDLNGNINHSACYWCYNSIPLEKFAPDAAKLGLVAIDLLRPEEWEVVEQYGLKCAVATDTFASITDGFNDPANHAKLQEQYTKLISQAAAKDIPNVICFSGSRRELSQEEGLNNCVTGLKPLVAQAEKEGVVLIMELLNSKVNHPDYQCDHTEWGVALCDRLDSDHFKLLYDIYHMQIMDGDIIATIREYHPYFAHYHTGGVPGRNEINQSQELNYPAIMQAIVDTGFKGYVAQEFVPTYTDKIAALKEGVGICDV